jgi:hypothetical protein
MKRLKANVTNINDVFQQKKNQQLEKLKELYFQSYSKLTDAQALIEATILQHQELDQSTMNFIDTQSIEDVLDSLNSTYALLNKKINGSIDPIIKD